MFTQQKHTALDIIAQLSICSSTHSNKLHGISGAQTVLSIFLLTKCLDTAASKRLDTAAFAKFLTNFPCKLFSL